MQSCSNELVACKVELEECLYMDTELTDIRDKLTRREEELIHAMMKLDEESAQPGGGPEGPRRAGSSTDRVG